MNKKAVSIVVAIVVAVIGLMAWGYGRTVAPTEAEHVASSSLAASETIYDFGTISMADGNVSHSFRVTNPTDKEVRINDLQTSCMCTTAYITGGGSKEGPFGMPGMGGMTRADLVIGARGNAEIEAVYDPAAHGPAGVGAIDRFVYATEENGGTLRLEIKALVTP